MAWTASTTFGDVKNEFYNSGFDYIRDNNQTDRAGRWVNQSYQEICGLERWPFLRTSTTGTAPISISDLGDILRVTDTALNRRLVENDEDSLADLNADLTVAGTASWYYLSYSTSPTVNTFPATTNTLSVVYYKSPASLTGDADVLLVPDEFIDVVVLGAMRRAYFDGTDAASQYQMVKAEYGDRLAYMRSQLLPKYTYQVIEFFPSSSTDW